LFVPFLLGLSFAPSLRWLPRPRFLKRPQARPRPNSGRVSKPSTRETSRRPRHQLGVAYFQSGQTEAAERELQRAAELDGKRFEIRFDLALSYLDQRKYAPAAEQLESALRLKAGNPLVHVLLGRA
jgi:Tfp pilus assembly protein PilF